jgi:hypothetical protein
MSLSSGDLAVHVHSHGSPADESRVIVVSTNCYDQLAAGAMRARLPTAGAGGFLDRAINRWLDLAEAEQLVCATCHTRTPHLLETQALLTIAVRIWSCARCGARREHRVLNLGPEPETDDRTSED